MFKRTSIIEAESIEKFFKEAKILFMSCALNILLRWRVDSFNDEKALSK